MLSIDAVLSRLGQGSKTWSLQRLRRYLDNVANSNPAPLALAVLAISLWPLVVVQNPPTEGDVGLYRAVSEDLASGRIPYRDHQLEYPPYAIPVFALPGLFGRRAYCQSWVAVAIVCDCLIKYLLFVAGAWRPIGIRSFLPMLSYCAVVPFIRYFYFERYDFWPALICLAAILLFCSGRHALSGLGIALGIGLKVYPVVFIPVLVIIAFRQDKGIRFVAGLIGGLAPIAVASFAMPWWRFAEFQTARGLQAESVYASVLWLGRLFGIVHVEWEFTKRWFEVTGRSASVLLPWARAMLVAGTGISNVLAARAAARWKDPSPGQLARLLLVPLLAFVAFNNVLSPQFMVWILPLAAIGSLEGRAWPMLAILFAVVLTPIFYPSLFDDYAAGLTLFETSILVIRNFALIAALGLLILSSLRELTPLPVPTVAAAAVNETGIGA
jgi:hypothetical protein